MAQLDARLAQRDVRRLVVQSIQRTVQCAGHYRDIKRGIARGSLLSPLFAALYLKPLDDALDQARIKFVRYMHDVLIVAPTRWALRRAVAVLNRTLTSLGLSKHPDKTFNGQTARGVDFLGYHFTHDGLTPSTQTLTRFHRQLTRLYEQDAAPPRIGAYVKRWCGI